jgi:biopolymer transport protein ExbD
MNPVPTPDSVARSAASSTTKWRLGLLILVAVVVLLPTLFLVIRTIAKPPVMQLSLPAAVASESAGPPTEALTILLGNGNQLYYYFGEATPTAVASLHTATLAQPIEQTIKAWQQHSKATIFIKPVAEANYKALVKMLDQMNSVGQREYKVMPPTEADRQLLANGQR